MEWIRGTSPISISPRRIPLGSTRYRNAGQEGVFKCTRDWRTLRINIYNLDSRWSEACTVPKSAKARTRNQFRFYSQRSILQIISMCVPLLQRINYGIKFSTDLYISNSMWLENGNWYFVRFLIRIAVSILTVPIVTLNPPVWSRRRREMISFALWEHAGPINGITGASAQSGLHAARTCDHRASMPPNELPRELFILRGTEEEKAALAR